MYFAHLNFTFFLWKIKIIIIPVQSKPHRCCEDKKNKSMYRKVISKAQHHTNITQGVILEFSYKIDMHFNILLKCEKHWLKKKRICALTVSVIFFFFYKLWYWLLAPPTFFFFLTYWLYSEPEIERSSWWIVLLFSEEL